MPVFNPALGNVYKVPPPKNVIAGSSAQLSQQSKENTPMSSTQATTPNGKVSLLSKPGTESDFKGMKTLAESYNLALRYTGEYMDDNPLIGEPGSFVLSKSQIAVPPSQPKAVTQTQNPTPVLPQIEIPKEPAPVRKGSKGGEKSPITPGTKDKKIRRKSKINFATTPKSIP